MGLMGVDGDKPHVLFVDRKGNQHYDRAWKKQVIAEALAPGASLSRVAITHGINTNLVRKWVRTHKASELESLPASPLLAPAFIPVRIEAAAGDIVHSHDHAEPRRAHAVDFPVRNSGEVWSPATVTPFSSAAKLNVSLPNGATLSLECDDVRALTAVLGVVSDV